MNKTLHQKLTSKHLYSNSGVINFQDDENIVSGFRQEMKMILEGTRELLQPRPEAIAQILKMSRSI